MANSRYDKLNKRLSYAFSNVSKDISKLRKESNEKFINREDYVKLFAAHTKLKKEHSNLIDNLKDDMNNKLSEINNRIRLQNKENNRINNHLARLVEKERANRSEIKAVNKIRSELDKLKQELAEFSTIYIKKQDYDKLNIKTDKNITNIHEKINNKLKEFNKKMDFLMKHSVDVNDVENNFITKKKVTKEIETIKRNFKKSSEKAHSNYETKMNLLKQEVDDINTTLKNINKSVDNKINVDEFNKTKSMLVEQPVLDKEMKKLKESLTSVNTDLKKLKSKKEVTHEELSKIQSDIDKIKNNIILKKEVEKILEANSIKYQKIKEDLDWAESKIKKMEKEVLKNNELDLTRFAETKDIIELKKQVEKTNNNLSKAMIKEKEVDRLGKQLDNIKNDINDKVTTKNMERTMTQVTSKLESLKKNITEIETKNASVKKVTEKITKKPKKDNKKTKTKAKKK
jgi:hypothetical protein